MLDDLARERLVTRLHPTQTLEGSAPEAAFALSRNGAKLFARESGEGAPIVPDARRSLFTLAHELAVAEIAIALEVLHRRGTIDLRVWETSREKIGASVLLRAARGIERVPLVADGYAVLARDGKLDAFLVECDRSTVSVARMQRKFAGYLAWSRASGPERRFGVRSLRVLVIVPDEARLKRLREAAVEATGGTGLIWFAVAQDVTAIDTMRLLGPVWRMARADDVERYTLTGEGDSPAADVGVAPVPQAA